MRDGTGAAIARGDTCLVMVRGVLSCFVIYAFYNSNFRKVRFMRRYDNPGYKTIAPQDHIDHTGRPEADL